MNISTKLWILDVCPHSLLVGGDRFQLDLGPENVVVLHQNGSDDGNGILVGA